MHCENDWAEKARPCVCVFDCLQCRNGHRREASSIQQTDKPEQVKIKTSQKKYGLKKEKKKFENVVFGCVCVCATGRQRRRRNNHQNNTICIYKQPSKQTGEGKMKEMKRVSE